MKKLLFISIYIIGFLLCLWGSTKAALVGKFDLSTVPASVVARNYTDGFWEAGLEWQLWNLNDTHTSQRLLYVAPQYLHGINGGNQSAGLVIGWPIFQDVGTLINDALSNINSGGNYLGPMPGWVKDVGNAVSIELGVGYNFLPEYQYIKPWFATMGAVVKIPIGEGTNL